MKTGWYHRAAGRKILLSQLRSGTALLHKRADVLGFRPLGRSVRSGAVSVAASASGSFVRMATILARRSLRSKTNGRFRECGHAASCPSDWQQWAAIDAHPDSQARPASLSSNPCSSASRSPPKSPTPSLNPFMARTKNWRKSFRSSHQARSFTPCGGCTRASGSTVRVVSWPERST